MGVWSRAQRRGEMADFHSWMIQRERRTRTSHGWQTNKTHPWQDWMSCHNRAEARMQLRNLKAYHECLSLQPLMAPPPKFRIHHKKVARD